MNKFVENAPQPTRFLWAAVSVTKGIYRWDGTPNEDISDVALFVSNGRGQVVIFYQGASSKNSGLEFSIAKDQTWKDCTFIKVRGKLTCEFVS